MLVLCLLCTLWPAAAFGAPAATEYSDDLGDVGYYYSQVGPNLSSTISVFNPGNETATTLLTLRNDVGTVVYTQTQTVAAGEQWQFLPAAVGMHGIFHGEVRSEDEPVAVFVSSRDDGNAPLHTGYLAARPADSAEELVLNEVTATGIDDPAAVEIGAVEIVLQNLNGHSNQVIFTLCPVDGLCFANNAAVLPAYGRRSFLLSQLAYSNRYGDGLTPVTGALRVTVAAEPDRPIAAVVNRFLPTAAGQAELGATTLTQTLATRAQSMSAASGNKTIPGMAQRLPAPGGSRFPVTGGADVSAARRRGDRPCGAHADTLWHCPVAAPVVPFVENTTSKWASATVAGHSGHRAQPGQLADDGRSQLRTTGSPTPTGTEPQRYAVVVVRKRRQLLPHGVVGDNGVQHSPQQLCGPSAAAGERAGVAAPDQPHVDG
ncbi:MAG: hypothetical protein R2873_30480 [Caldilineaceae bacterium]